MTCPGYFKVAGIGSSSPATLTTISGREWMDGGFISPMGYLPKSFYSLLLGNMCTVKLWKMPRKTFTFKLSLINDYVQVLFYFGAFLCLICWCRYSTNSISSIHWKLHASLSYFSLSPPFLVQTLSFTCCTAL